MNLVLFADDTSILYTGNSNEDLRTSTRETLEKTYEFLNENKLLLHVDKTEPIVFGEENNLKTFIYRGKTIPANEHAGLV